MAEKTIEKLKEELNCSICLDTYKDPKLLQCFHVFCTRCLAKLVIRDEQGQLFLNCPVCRHVTPVPGSNGVQDLQSAFQFNHFLEILEEHETKVSGKGEEESGIPPKKTIPLCSSHGSKELELFCETCDELICCHCALRGQKHHSHKYDLISVCFEKYKTEVVPSLKPIRKRLLIVERALVLVDKLSGDISKQQASIEEDIHHSMQQFRELIDSREKSLIDQLHQMTQEKLKDLEMEKSMMETLQAKLSSCHDFVKETIKSNSQGEVLKMRKNLLKQMKELNAFDPKVLKPSTKADLLFVDSTKGNLKRLCANYGQVISPAKPEPSQCNVLGRAITEVAMVGEKSTIIVQVNNFKGVPCEREQEIKSFQCELVSEITGAVMKSSSDLKKRGNGQYEISYLPTIKGKHMLHIKFEDQHIRGSPFPIVVHLPVIKLGTPILTIGGLSEPWGVAVNAKGEEVVTEYAGHCLSIFNSSGEMLESFGSCGSSKGEFKFPCGVTVDSEGNILVTDSLNHRIQKFMPDGLFCEAVGSKGNRYLQFDTPKGITFNASNGNVYIVDTFNHRVQILNSDLTFSGSFGKKGSSRGQFNNPHGVACDSTGQIFVTDGSNHRIQVFTAEGYYLKSFGKLGSGRGELDWPFGIAIDSNDIVYVSEGGNHRISVFTSEGKFMTSFGEEGNKPGEFKHPRGVAVDTTGVVYVCDRDNNCIQAF